MLRILNPLCSFFVIAQQPVFDGVVSAKEWQDAQQLSTLTKAENWSVASLFTNAFKRGLQFILQRIYCAFDYKLSI